MNIPKLFEGALADTITQHAALTDLPRMRTWQAIDRDARWSPLDDRTFPVIDIRGGPPRVDTNDGCTLICSLAVLLATWGDDDKTHADVARYYEAVQAVLDSLYSQFRAGVAGVERDTFDRHIEDQLADQAGSIAVGGFVFGEPMEPFEDSGANFIGMTFEVHYSRRDF